MSNTGAREAVLYDPTKEPLDFRCWDDFLVEWNLVINGIRPRARMLGLLHGGCHIALKDPMDKIARIRFYLQAADKRHVSDKMTEPVKKYYAVAYKALLDLLNMDVKVRLMSANGVGVVRESFSFTRPHADKPHSYNLSKVGVEYSSMLLAVTDFFSWFNNSPEFVKNISRDEPAEILRAISNIPPYKFLSEMLADAQKNVPKALVACCGYRYILETKMYSALSWLKERALQELPDALYYEDILDKLDNQMQRDLLMGLVQIPLHQLSAYNTYVRLWAHKLLTKIGTPNIVLPKIE